MSEEIEESEITETIVENDIVNNSVLRGFQKDREVVERAIYVIVMSSFRWGVEKEVKDELVRNLAQVAVGLATEAANYQETCIANKNEFLRTNGKTTNGVV